MDEVTVLTVSYDGAPFAGFARQAGRETVQSRLERALATALRRDVRVECAGRTDAGVHALGQVVSFSSGTEDPEDAVLLRALNALAGPEVVVSRVRRAAAGFSARHSAVSREYRYRIVPGPVPPLFLRHDAWWVKGDLDLGAMRRASAALIGEHDFASFCVSATAARVGTVRSVDLIEVTSEPEMGERCAVVRIAGRAFLHSMVRIVVGSLVDVGRGRRPESWMAEALAARERAAAGPTAPPCGLTFWRVTYPEGLWLHA
jgi:tRNA pseudouridine38-40 synthase